jgi:hypothetical protein
MYKIWKQTNQAEQRKNVSLSSKSNVAKTKAE